MTEGKEIYIQITDIEIERQKNKLMGRVPEG